MLLWSSSFSLSAMDIGLLYEKSTSSTKHNNTEAGADKITRSYACYLKV